ncbi:hypothetical protein TNCV_2997441 [Trichonephila clavipes]|nr:hypothetical protein TNCV_2997441 [Trichonephila clavipes]
MSRGPGSSRPMPKDRGVQPFWKECHYLIKKTMHTTANFFNKQKKMKRNKIWKTPARLDCPTVSSEEFGAINVDDVCTTSIMEFVQSSKNIIDVDSDDENEMNNAAPLFLRHSK